MRVFYKNALLITNDETFEKAFLKTAETLNAEVEVKKEWKKIYATDAPIIACDTKTIETIASSYINRVVLYVKKDEKIQDFVSLGVSNFIFDIEDKRQLVLAFTKNEYRDLSTKSWTQSDKLLAVLDYAASPVFESEHYYFDFANGNYRYNDTDIYISPTEEIIIAKWILLGIKEKDKLSNISHMRTKFGKEFLSDINDDGTVKRKAVHV